MDVAISVSINDHFLCNFEFLERKTMFSDVLLTVDYDRTLTAPDSTIPQRNLEAIRYFMDNGGAFTVNTGRSVPMAMAMSKIVPVNAPFLLYNGSAAWDKEKLDFCHPIELDMWQTVRAVQKAFPDMTVEIQGVDAHYRLTDPDDAWDAFSDHNNCARGYAPQGTDLGVFLKFSLYGQIRDVTVAHLFEGSEEEMARMSEVESTLNEMFGDKISVFRAAPRIIDCHAKGVSKIRSARELQQRLGRKILVCVGDAENDISMLEGADFAFCPADGIVANRFETVCECGKGAVADVIYEKIPEILGLNP